MCIVESVYRIFCAIFGFGDNELWHINTLLYHACASRINLPLSSELFSDSAITGVHDPIVMHRHNDCLSVSLSLETTDERTNEPTQSRFQQARGENNVLVYDGELMRVVTINIYAVRSPGEDRVSHGVRCM